MINKIVPVDIVIIRFNTPDLDIKCSGSIIGFTKYSPYNIILHDNSVINQKLSYLWNMYFEKSDSEFICLLNNDTRILFDKGDWLTKMMETMLSDDSIGAVGPSTNNCGNPQKMKGEWSTLPNIRQEVDMEKTYSKQWQLSGFCLLIRREAWKVVKGFSYKYAHYGQENEFLHQIQKAGYKTMWRKDAFVWHVGRASSSKVKGFNDEKQRRTANELYQLSLKK